MQIHLLAIGTRMPDWVQRGYQDYVKRLPAEFAPRLQELAPGRRSRQGDTARAVAQEGERMLKHLPKAAYAVALDEHGEQWDSQELAHAMADWARHGNPVALLIGGPDGLAATARQRADRTWSLSRLTLPHALVRLVLVEQLYRAWTILNKHPYHRGG